MADLIFRGGSGVYLGQGRRAEAVLVQGDRIAAVGTSEGIAERAGRSVRVVDLDGGMVLPAFQDAHAHPLFGGLAKLQCDLHDISPASEVLTTIRRYVADHPDEPWIAGSGWQLHDFPEGPHRTTSAAWFISEEVAGRRRFWCRAIGSPRWEPPRRSPSVRDDRCAW